MNTNKNTRQQKINVLTNKKKYNYNGLTDKQKAIKLSKVNWNKPITKLSYTD